MICARPPTNRETSFKTLPLKDTAPECRYDALGTTNQFDYKLENALGIQRLSFDVIRPGSVSQESKTRKLERRSYCIQPPLSELSWEQLQSWERRVFSLSFTQLLLPDQTARRCVSSRQSPGLPSSAVGRISAASGFSLWNAERFYRNFTFRNSRVKHSS